MEKVRERIRMILQEFDLSPSLFADSIQVQRPNISHILSGRNNPSLEVVKKILTAYPEIRPEWLLIGKGEMKQLNLFGEEEDTSPVAEAQIDLKSTRVEKQTIQNEKPATEITTSSFSDKKVEKIIVFYSDKTCSIYHPE